MRKMLAVLTMLLGLALSGCLAGSASCFTDGNPAGFAAGVWHGLLTPVTLVVSFLYEGVRMYEAHNAGPIYDMGFVMGFLILLSIPATLRSIRKRKS